MTVTGTRTAAGRRQWPTIALELLVAASAVHGGAGLVWDLVGDNAIGMSQDWLDATPFTSWVLPGVFLLAVVAVPMGAAAVLELRRSPWAGAASVVAGAAQVGWIAVQLAVVQRYSVLQPVMIGAGLAVLALALWSSRHRPLVPGRGAR
jgi:CBS-domain-containing membrane protein